MNDQLDDKIEAILTDEDVETDFINEEVRKGQQPGEAYRLNRLRTVEAMRDLIESAVKQAEKTGGINALNDLKKWSELHQLNAEMMMDGIEHMMASLTQQLEATLKGGE